jgi:hypothetical protein
MCYNCGCKIPDDEMGDSRNITIETFESLAKKWKISSKDARNKVFNYLMQDKTDNEDIEEIFRQASQAWGQPIQNAKKETLLLLDPEF